MARGSYHKYATTGYYGGGSNSIHKPQKIKCNGCSVVKSPAGFSIKKLELLQEHIFKLKLKNRTFNAEREPYIPCVGCTPKQVTELTCYYCDKTKGLDKFFKAQRRNPDKATCIACAKERESTGPGDDDSDSKGSSGSGSDSGSNDSGDDYGGASVVGMTSAINNLSITNAHSTYPSSTGGSTGGVSLTGATPSISVAPGFNPNKDRSMPSVAGSATTNKTATKKGSWAKVTAGPKSKVGVSSEDEDQDVLSSDSD